MVRGLESFREWFAGHDDQYVIIGGTACDLLMTEEGLDFRATRDIDLVLIIEAIDAAFGKRFWEYVVAAGYEHRSKSTGKQQFYRFARPQSREYPSMIELFSRKPDAIRLPEGAVLSPLPMEEDVSSLSAILLDEDYYELLKKGRVRIAGVTALSAEYMIPFKAKAWMDLSERRAKGEHVDEKSVRKHKNDIFRLTELLNPDEGQISDLPAAVRADMAEFIGRMHTEPLDLRQIGIHDRTKESILSELRNIYG